MSGFDGNRHENETKSRTRVGRKIRWQMQDVVVSKLGSRKHQFVPTPAQPTGGFGTVAPAVTRTPHHRTTDPAMRRCPRAASVQRVHSVTSMPLHRARSSGNRIQRTDSAMGRVTDRSKDRNVVAPGVAAS